MRRNSVFMAVAAAVLSGATSLASAAFTVGNIAVSRVGTGTGALGSTATAAFIDEYTTAGASTGYSVALPTAASGSNYTLTLSGTTTSQGFLTRSSDGRYMTIFGYDAPVGTTGPSSNATFRGRSIAVIDMNGNIDTTNRFEAAGTTPRSVVTVDGTGFWVASDGGSGSTGGLRYTAAGSGTNGTLLNTATTNIRVANISRGQLYIGASTGVPSDFRGVSQVGSGLPMGAASFALLPGMGGSNSGNTDSTYDFFFADANTVYLADDDTTAPASGGLQKWSFNTGTSTWSKVWTVSSTTGARSITGRKLDNGNVEIYFIAANATTDLMRVLDTGSGTPTPTLLASAPTNTAFRGVEFVPEPTTLTVLASMAFTALRRRRA